MMMLSDGIQPTLGGLNVSVDNVGAWNPSLGGHMYDVMWRQFENDHLVIGVLLGNFIEDFPPYTYLEEVNIDLEDFAQLWYVCRWSPYYIY